MGKLELIAEMFIKTWYIWVAFTIGLAILGWYERKESRQAGIALSMSHHPAGKGPRFQDDDGWLERILSEPIDSVQSTEPLEAEPTGAEKVAA